MTTTEVSRAEKCRVIAERVMGWKWVQAPKYDYDGKLPDQGLVLVYPELDEKTHRWPPKGLIPPYAYVDGSSRTKYFTDPAAMVEVMGKARISVKPVDTGWNAFGANSAGEWVCSHGPTPMAAVAEAAYQWAVTSAAG